MPESWPPVGWTVRKVGIGKALRERRMGRSTGNRKYGVLIEKKDMWVYVTDRKIRVVGELAKRIVAVGGRNRRLVPLAFLLRFCKIRVSLIISLPMAYFYTRDISFHMSLCERQFGPQAKGAIPRGSGRGGKKKGL